MGIVLEKYYKAFQYFRENKDMKNIRKMHQGGKNQRRCGIGGSCCGWCDRGDRKPYLIVDGKEDLEPLLYARPDSTYLSGLWWNLDSGDHESYLSDG